MTDDRIAALESELAKAQAEADRWRSDYRELQALHSSVAAKVLLLGVMNQTVQEP